MLFYVFQFTWLDNISYFRIQLICHEAKNGKRADTWVNACEADDTAKYQRISVTQQIQLQRYQHIWIKDCVRAKGCTIDGAVTASADDRELEIAIHTYRKQLLLYVL